MEHFDVVIAGAGPVGLSLALGLAHTGRSLLVIEKQTGLSEHSRAPAVWPRTQEIFAALGVLERMRRSGIVVGELGTSPAPARSSACPSASSLAKRRHPCC